MSWGCIIYKRCMACFATLFITRGKRRLPYRTQESRASPVVLSCLRIRPSLTRYIILQHGEFGYSSNVCQVKPFLPQLLTIYLYFGYSGASDCQIYNLSFYHFKKAETFWCTGLLDMFSKMQCFKYSSTSSWSFDCLPCPCQRGLAPWAFLQASNTVTGE